MLPPINGNYETNLSTPCRIIPPFINFLNALVDYNLKVLNNLTIKSNARTILQFMTSLHQIVEQNQFDHIINNHNKFQHMVNVKKQSKQEFAQCLHGACMSLTSSTFTKVIKNNYFMSWLGLIPKLVSKYLLTSIPTIQYHLKTERKGLQSTKIIPFPKQELDESDEDYFPP